MKRNFLLMLLLTLLPLAGWAVNYHYVQVTWNPSSTTATFTGGTMPLPVPTVTYYSGGYQTLSSSNYTVTWKYNGGSTVTVAEHAGTYTATITHTGDNWNSGSGNSDNVTTTHTYTISRGTNTITAPSFPDGATWKYGETPNAPSSTTTDGVATYQYSLNGGSTWLDWPVPTNTKPGTYSVKALVAQTVDYNQAESTASTFTIEKAPVTVTLGNVVREWRNPWQKPAMDEITETVSGGGKTWDLISDNFDWNQLETVGDVGNYAYSLTVNATGLADEYFEYIVTGTGTVNVEKNTKASVAGGGDGADLVYDGTAQQLKPGTVCAYRDPQNNEAGKVQYKITAPAGAVTEWSDDIPTAKDADTYTIEVRGVGDVNHTDYQDDAEPLNYYDVTIKPYEITTADFNEPTPLTVTYKDAGDHKQVIAEAATWKDGALKDELAAGVRFTYPFSTSLPEKTDVGKYDVQYFVDVYASTNFVYKGGTKTLSTQAEITKADIAAADVTAPVGETGLEYILDTAQELIATAAVCAKGTPQYSLDGGTTWTDDVTKVTKEHADTYTINWYIKGDANHNDYTPTEDEFEVAIAPVDFVLTADAEVATGLVFNNKAQALLSKSVTGGAANMPEGSTTWSVDGTALAAGSKYTDVKATHAGEYTISYTVVPKDAKYENDYNPYSKELKATIGQYTLYIGGNEIEGTIEDVVDLATGTPKISMADFIKDGALIGGEDDATKAAILNSLIAPTQTLEEIITNAKVGVNAVGLQAVDVTPAKKAETNYKVDAAHLLSNAASLKINAKEAAIQSAPVGFADTELTYNGDDQELVKTAADGYKANGGAGTVAIGKVVYSLEETGTYTDDLTTIVGKDADTYTVYYKVELDESDAATNLDRFYEYTAGVKSFDVVINKKELALGMFTFSDDDMKAEYTGGNLKPEVSIATTEKGLKEGDFTVTADETMINVGTYTFTFTATADGNYKDPDPKVSTTFQITQKALDADMFALVTEGDVIFNGQPQKPTITAADGEGDPNPLVAGDWTYEIKDGEGNVVGIDEMVDADTYTFTFTATSTGNYKNATEAIAKTFEIAPKALTRDLFVFEDTPAENPTQDFTGKYLTFDFAVADAEDDILTADDYTCERDDMIIDAGDYNFKFTGKKNYTGSFTVKCTVAPIEQNVVAPKAINLTYNGGEQVLVEAGSTDAVAGSTDQPAGVIEYQVTFGNEVVVEWTSDINEVVGKNAGVYTVKSRAIASDVNYTNTPVVNSVDVEIKRADIGYMLSNLEKTWNGEAFSAEEVAKVFTLYAGKLFGDDAYDVPFTLSLPEDYRDADTYTFKQPKVEFKEGYPVNYNVNFTGEAEIVINKADIKATDYVAPAEKDVMTFNAEAQKLVEAGEVNTTYQYPEMEEAEPIAKILYFEGETAPAEDDEASWTTDVPEKTNANAAEEVYTVWYMVKGDDNHNNIAPKKLTAKIQPKAWDAQLAFDNATVAYNTLNQTPNTELKDGETALEEGTDYDLSITFVPANGEAAEVNPEDVAITCLSGSDFGENEGCDKLFDGKTGTKWGSWDLWEGKKPTTVCKTSVPIAPASYDLVIANDTYYDYNHGRNWKSWKIYGANFANDEAATADAEGWVLLDNKQDQTLTTDQYAAVPFTLSNASADTYSYFKIVVEGLVDNNSYCQMDEFRFTGFVGEPAGPAEPVEVAELVNAGKYVFVYTGKGNYAGATVERTIEITPVDLATVTINEKNGGLITEYEEKTVVYNTEDQKPTLTLKYMYFEDEEDETPKAAEDLVAGKDFTVAAEDEMINAGEYTFTFTGKGNYIGETTATFEIKKKEVVAEVVPESAKKTYNGLAGFETLLGAEPVAIKLSYNNPYPNDKFEFVYDNTAFAVANDAIDAGFYEMTVDADKIVADNYEAVIDNAEFEIEQATLLINWRSGVTATKVYGAEDPELVTAANVATAGAVNANDEERILNCIVATYEGENVGKYDITVAVDDEADDADVLENYDYTINNEFGKQAFEITAAKIKVSLATQEKPYNGQNAAPDVTASTLIITGLLNGEKKEDVVTEFPVATVNGGEEAVVAGTYDVELSGGKFANYEVEEYLPSVITIVKAQVVASIEPYEAFAGTPAADIDPEFTVTCGDEDYSEFFKVVVAGKYQDENGLIKGSGTYADGLVLVIDNMQDAANITGWNNVKGELTVISTVLLSDAEDFVSEAKSGVNVTFTDRAINTNNWNVVALPFDATIAQISEAFGYAAVDRLNRKAADGNIHFEVVTSGTIPAFEPFIIKTTDDKDLVKKNFTDVVFEGVNIEAWDGSNNYVDDHAQNKFWGTFQASTEIYGQKCWYMSKGAWKDARNFTAEKPVTLKPFRAYVEFDEKNVAAGARIYIEEPDGTETAIDAVEFNQMVNGDTYTVDGKKVSNTAQKGIYIQNGKKIAVK